MKNIVYIIVALGLFSTVACNLEQEIDLELPVYESQYVVEAYLEPGQPFRILLTESAPYFEEFPTLDEQFLENILVNDAEVSISHKGETYVLENGLFFDFFTGKLYNYGNPTLVPADFEEDFNLEITTRDDEMITGTTKVFPPVPIDSVVVEFQENDTLARVLTYFSDDLSEANFYRYMLHRSSLDSTAYQDFIINDEVVDSETIVFGTAYDFAEGDTIINSLLHIDLDYYSWVESVAFAVGSNGNPFGQPGKLQSNIEGDANAIGVFTGFSPERITTIIEK